MIMIVTITIIILIVPGRKRGDGNAALHIRSNVGLSKRSHSFTLNPRKTGAHCSILAHICYFVCSLIFTCKTSNLQIERVVDAWDWTSDDSVLHCIGLGSTYGLINSLQVIFHRTFYCFGDGFDFFFWESVVFHFQAPLSMGAKITLMPQFDPLKVNVC